MASIDPVIRNFDGDAVVFQHGFGPVPLDARDAGENAGRVAAIGLALVDPDSPDFDGGRLTVAITANGVTGEDV